MTHLRQKETGVTCEVEIIVANSDNLSNPMKEFAHALRERIATIIREAELETKHIHQDDLRVGGPVLTSRSELKDYEFQLILTHDKAHVSLWTEVIRHLIPWMIAYSTQHALRSRGMMFQTFGERQRLKAPVPA